MSNTELIDSDWVTALMYGKNLPKRKNDIPLSKNGFEPFEELNDEVNEILDLLDNTIFTPKENRWSDDSLK